MQKCPICSVKSKTPTLSQQKQISQVSKKQSLLSLLLMNLCYNYHIHVCQIRQYNKRGSTLVFRKK